MAPVGKVGLITDLPYTPPHITLHLAFSWGSYPGGPITLFLVCHCQIKCCPFFQILTAQLWHRLISFWNEERKQHIHGGRILPVFSAYLSESRQSLWAHWPPCRAVAEHSALSFQALFINSFLIGTEITGLVLQASRSQQGGRGTL